MLCCSVCVHLSTDYFPWSLVVDTAGKKHIQTTVEVTRCWRMAEGKILSGVCKGKLHV